MTVRQIAASDVVTATPHESVSKIAKRMGDQKVGSVVVVEGETPAGIVTDREIALELSEKPELGTHEVREVMTRDVRTVHENASIFQAAQVLEDAGIRRAPVVDDDGRLVGIVSLDDILVVVEEEFDTAADVIEKQSPRM